MHRRVRQRISVRIMSACYMMKVATTNKTDNREAVMRQFPSNIIEELMHEIENKVSTREQVAIVDRLLFNTLNYVFEKLH
jgi:hypothetical protein